MHLDLVGDGGAGTGPRARGADHRARRKLDRTRLACGVVGHHLAARLLGDHTGLHPAARHRIDLGGVGLHIDRGLVLLDRVGQPGLDHVQLVGRQVEQPDVAAQHQAQRVQGLLLLRLGIGGGRLESGASRGQEQRSRQQGSDEHGAVSFHGRPVTHPRPRNQRPRTDEPRANGRTDVSPGAGHARGQVCVGAGASAMLPHPRAI